jgi:small basic protein
MNIPEHLTFWAIVKNASYFGALFLALPAQGYSVLAAFMVLDTVLGVVRVGVVHGYREIKSYRLVSGLMAKLSIILVPLIIAHTGKGIGLDLHMIALWALNLLILSHAYSILGNIHSIYLRKDVYEFDAVSWTLTKIQGVIEKALKQGAPDKELYAKDTNRDQTVTTDEHGK